MKQDQQPVGSFLGNHDENHSTSGWDYTIRLYILVSIWQLTGDMIGSSGPTSKDRA